MLISFLIKKTCKKFNHLNRNFLHTATIVKISIFPSLFRFFRMNFLKLLKQFEIIIKFCDLQAHLKCL
jgi:hypothetical protein